MFRAVRDARRHPRRSSFLEETHHNPGIAGLRPNGARPFQIVRARAIAASARDLARLPAMAFATAIHRA
jgi:hypothetical protein